MRGVAKGLLDDSLNSQNNVFCFKKNNLKKFDLMISDTVHGKIANLKCIKYLIHTKRYISLLSVNRDGQ